MALPTPRRPPRRSVRDKVLQSWVSEEELAVLKEAADRASLSLSAYTRHAVLAQARRVVSSTTELVGAAE